MNSLRTQADEEIEILKTGEHNLNAGPDFFNARVKINGITWIGNIEVHVNSSDWTKHRHQQDRAYDNVILHLVYHHDCEVKGVDGKIIPTLELKGRISENLVTSYLKLMNNKSWIPCNKGIQEVHPFIIIGWLDRMVIERMQSKSEKISAELELNNHNWAETFYQQLAAAFGLKLNSLPFELLAKSLPEIYLAKHKDDIFYLEALLFGQAGMLEENFKDHYPNELKATYKLLKQKFGLKPIEKHLWKFFRLRPVSFPTLRIAQFAQLTYQSSNLFSKILEADTLGKLLQFFVVSTTPYWKTHYTFDKPSVAKLKYFGGDSAAGIIINTVIPFLFVYGEQKQQELYKDRALAFLEEMKPENNTIIEGWQNVGLVAESAHETQALLQLKNQYCDNKKCLQCNIGNYLIKNSYI
jgi:hypothetical protein